MGNNATREAPPPGSSPTGAMHRRPASLIPGGSETNPSGSRTFYRETGSDSRREGGRSRSDFPIIGIGGSSSMGAEPRRETKQEREARRAERDRIARERERERSMREESVDGGYLVTLGVYTGPEDFSRPIVRQLMIERRLAPFWKGLNDHSDSWTEYQLVAAARGLPIPAADEIPPEDLVRPPSKHHQEQAVPEQNISHLTIPISSRSQSYNSDASPSLSPSHPAFSNSGSLPTSPGHSSFPLRSRSKTLASLSSGSNSQQPDMFPQEVELPKDSFVDGLPLEAYLYRNASECPICFLYYPPYLNQTRCCDQSICSECFVQIKRPDPHPPEYHDQSPPSAEVQAQRAADPEGQLVCEPAACPFCVQPEFGVTYTPPQFRRGLAYANQSSSHPLSSPGSAMSSSASLHSGASSPTTPARRRATSLAANAPSVITTDKIRPDWASKLASARAHAARRSAAATALHTAAYLMGSMGNGDGRSFAGFGRRNRRESPVGTSGAPRDPFSGMHPVHRSYLSAMAGSNPSGSNRIDGNGPGGTYPDGSAEPSRQQSRMEDLDDMMMAEAIRLSLVAEEERKKKEEKEAKKEAKKKEKEEKKAQKAARKGSYQSSNNNSSSALVGDGAQTINTSTNDGKGKGIDRVEGPLASAHQGGNAESSATSLGLPHLAPSEPLSWNFPISEEHQTRGGSHLRKVSNVSSSESSLVDNSPSPMDHATGGVDASKSSKESTSRAADGGSDGEPLFNFRSLASMIGEDEKTTEATHAEHSHYHRGEITSPKQQYSIDPQDQGQGTKHGHNELSSASTANP